jgi:hypothetical protein
LSAIGRSSWTDWHNTSQQGDIQTDGQSPMGRKRSLRVSQHDLVLTGGALKRLQSLAQIILAAGSPVMAALQQATRSVPIEARTVRTTIPGMTKRAKTASC